MPDRQPDVSVVIVHYETPDLLTTCLAALAATRGPVSTELIVVDNASAAFPESAVRALDPSLRVIRNATNVGFATAANEGLRQASGRYLLLLNPDAFVEPDTLSLMVGYMDERPDVGCSTARLVREDGRLDLACRRSFPTPSRAFLRLSLLSRLFPRNRHIAQYNLTYLDESEEAEIDSPCGAFMMVRRQVAEQVGGLDESYFMYGEDIDWAYRIKQAGWRVTYTPITTVRHVKGASSRLEPQRTVRAFHDAMRIFYRRHYQQRYPRWLSWFIFRAIDVREAIQLAVVRLGRRPRGFTPRAART
ncbi:MAG: glycosyltransferase family 2 protein [Chloroflexota bacterium]|nr:glycosyltransferase family 2 protein [Chloroflexota bacterium]